MRKYSFDWDYFKYPTVESAYWAGFIAADGCIRNNPSQLSITLSEKDKSHLQNFVKCIKYTGPIRYNIIKKDGMNRHAQCNLTICGITQNLAEHLYKIYNLTPKKSLTLLPPNSLTGYTKLAFIKGLIDGDGTIYRDSHNRLQFSICGTKEILDYICEEFNIISPPTLKGNVIPKQRLDRTNNNHYTYKITGYRAERILKVLHKIETPELYRKWSNLDTVKLPKYKKYLTKFE